MAYPLFMGIQTLDDSRHGRNRIYFFLQKGYEGMRDRFNQVCGYTNPFIGGSTQKKSPKFYGEVAKGYHTGNSTNFLPVFGASGVMEFRRAPSNSLSVSFNIYKIFSIQFDFTDDLTVRGSRIKVGAAAGALPLELSYNP